MDSKIEQTWARYSQSKSNSLRDVLVKYYQHLVMYIAAGFRRSLSGALEFDDLISAGNMGLLEAIDRFDPAKEIKFETFATLRIRGAIIDLLRRNDWASKLTRKKIKSVLKAMMTLQKQLGRNPSESEVADALGWDMKEYRKVLQSLNAVNLLSLQDVLSLDENGELTRAQVTEDRWQGSDSDLADHKELKEKLVQALSKLPGKERLLLILYYYEGLNLAEIANILGVTESRACQLHTQALLRVRNEFANLELVPV